MGRRKLAWMSAVRERSPSMAVRVGSGTHRGRRRLAVDSLHHRDQLLRCRRVRKREARAQVAPGVDKVFEMLGRCSVLAGALAEALVGCDEIGITWREDGSLLDTFARRHGDDPEA